MKKVFGILSVLTMLVVATVLTGCNEPYSGRYYDVECVYEVSDADYNAYNEKEGSDRLVAFYGLCDTYSDNYEKITYATENEVADFLRKNYIAETAIQSIIESGKEVKKGNGWLESFYYMSGTTKLHDIYFFVLKN